MDLIVVAHPDDEVIGLGGQLASFEEVRILYVTDGAPRDMRDATDHGFATLEEYSRARREEAKRALAVSGIDAECAVWMGMPDQATSGRMAELSRRVCALLGEMLPATVWTHPYEGGHPDHDATAFAVQCACLLVAPCAPERREFTSYHARGEAIVAYEFLPYAGVTETEVTLDEEARQRKLQMFACYGTQERTLEVFTHAAAEKWRRAPIYDFTSPPHAGTLYYDQFPWGMKGAEWRTLAAAALKELGL